MRVSVPSVTMYLLSACWLMSLPAAAQCINPALPIQQLAGTTWAFQTSDGLDAAVGIFSASLAPARAGGLQGQLNITESAYTQGYGPQQETTVTGIYTVDPDCSGGVLYFTGANYTFQYHFVFAAGDTRMFMVAENDNLSSPILGVGLANHGSAVLLPGVPTCGGANPLSAFAGKWSFSAHDALSAWDGILTASLSGTTGFLTSTQSVVGAFTQLSAIDSPSQGSYQVYPDCSGGTLHLNAAVNSTDAFVFAGPNQIYMAGLSPVRYPNLVPETLSSIGRALRY